MKKLLNVTTAMLVGLSSISAHAGMFIPEMTMAIFWPGLSVWDEPGLHLIPACPPPPLPPLPTCASDIPHAFTIWLDPGMIAATALDYGASLMQGDRTIDAKDAIKKLEEALEGGSGGGTSGGQGTSEDTTSAATYTPDMIVTQFDVKKVSAETMFENTRQAVQDYLFETAAADVKGDCDLDDKSCATQRQNTWLLASVTLASATADKVLDKTAKSKVKDGQTPAEQSEDEKNSNSKNESTGGGMTTLTAHFKKLASNFNKQTSPTGLYNRMADIVLDTHRQINDANALFGRDLEAQGLRVINEEGPTLHDGSNEEGEGED